MLRHRTLAIATGVLGLLPLLAACESVQFFVANVPTVVGPYDRHADIAYGPGERHGLDVYVPRGAHDNAVIVFWYGGTWTSGSKDKYRFVGAALASEGMVVVVPDYRLYPKVRFPAFVEDAAEALVWVHQHAREFGGDPQRIFVMGHSAGAHQAAMLAYDARWLQRAGGDRRWIRGLIGLSGPYWLTPNSDLLYAIFAAPYTPADWQPGRFVDGAAPPSALFHGSADMVVVPEHAIALDAALRKAGVPSELELYPRLGHVDTLAALSLPARRRAPLVSQIKAFIERIGPSR
jgi:acetyl esterase/lipase